MMETPLQVALNARHELVELRDSKARDETGFRHVRDRCESPIEVAYSLALFQVPSVRGRTLDRIDQVINSRSRAQSILVFAQCPILQYRVDFLLVGKNVPNPGYLVIECDGAEYHSAENDAGRDRQLKARGFEILRFRGGEIYEHPERVVAATLDRFGLPPVPLGSIYLAVWELRQRSGSFGRPPAPPPKLPILDEMLAAFKARGA